MYLATTEGSTRQLVWVDRSGRVEGTIGQPQARIFHPALSPDGRRVAVTGVEQGNWDIWLHDTVLGTKTRFTSDPAQDVQPVWSPTGDRIMFNSYRNQHWDMYIQTLNGRDEPVPLHVGPADNGAPDWSRDGKYLVYHGVGPDTKEDLWCLSFTGDWSFRPFLQTRFHELLPVFSPNGRYVAYESEESGQLEVYVKPFPSGAGTWRVSFNGGMYPKWNGHGNELFYVEPSTNTLMAVTVETRSEFRAGQPQKLFTGEQVGARLVAGVNEPLYTVTADGQRFVVVQTVGGGMTTPITVVKQWAAQFKKQP